MFTKRLGCFGINLLLLLCLPVLLVSRQIDTFYGPLEVNEPVLLELIDSPAFQRLKLIHQYGVAYYTDFTEEYNRYDHSIGVFAILRVNNASLEEQIAGLLHDVSHTAFSHVGDWIFSKQNQEKDYQNEIHPHFLRKSGLADILERYQLTVEQILPVEELFPALENSLPNLCADRIDYNIQGAYHQGYITHEEAVAIFNDLRFDGSRWVSAQPELMKKLTRYSLFMTQSCWGSPTNSVNSTWLADAILRAIDLGSVTYEELHFGTDQEIWNKLMADSDPLIRQNMRKIIHFDQYYTLVDSAEEADVIVKSKFRGIDPWVDTGNLFERITSLDETLAREYAAAKMTMEKGWPIKYVE